MEQAIAGQAPSPPVGISPLRLSLIPPDLIDQVWEQAAPYLQESADLSRGRYLLSDIRQKIEQSEWHLWVVFEPGPHVVAAITSSFAYYPQAKALQGQFLGGTRLAEWRDMFCDTFDRWAKDNGCRFIEFVGRPGWVRALAPNGYEERFRIYYRDL